jgi:hypothetical protein
MMIAHAEQHFTMRDGCLIDGKIDTELSQDR